MSNYACPKCSGKWIVAKATVDHLIGGLAGPETESGMYEFDAVAWDTKSKARCESCGYSGTVSEFEVLPTPRGWNIYESDTGYRIERDDGADPLFDSDEEALSHIYQSPEEAREAIQELLALLNGQPKKPTAVERAREIAQQLKEQMDWEDD